MLKEEVMVSDSGALQLTALCALWFCDTHYVLPFFRERFSSARLISGQQIPVCRSATVY